MTPCLDTVLTEITTCESRLIGSKGVLLAFTCQTNGANKNHHDVMSDDCCVRRSFKAGYRRHNNTAALRCCVLLEY